MTSRIFWIASDKVSGLAIMARPRSGEWLEDEIASYKREGIDVVISLLESHEIAELELQQEAKFCEAAGIKFLVFPIADRRVPLFIKETRKFIEDILAYAKQDKKVAIHCRAGIGRSSMMAAALLLHFGYDADSAFKLIGNSRGVNVPDTDEQRIWVQNYEQIVNLKH